MYFGELGVTLPRLEEDRSNALRHTTSLIEFDCFCNMTELKIVESRIYRDGMKVNWLDFTRKQNDWLIIEEKRV